MTKYENNLRVCARGITFIKDKVLLIERYKLVDDILMHYYTIPGGGVESDETYEEAAIRETKEETCVNTEIVKYFGKETYDTGIVYWYLLKYLNGKPQLGGEELERNIPTNSYKVLLIPFNKIKDINILGDGKKKIIEAYEYWREYGNKI